MRRQANPAESENPSFVEIGALKRTHFLVKYASIYSRYSVVVAQRFCKPLVGGSNPSAGSSEKTRKPQ